MSKFRLNCRPLEDTACRIHARHPAQLDARFDNAVGVGHHRHSDSPLRPRPNSVILSSVLGALLYAASSEDHRQAAIVKRTGTLLLALFLGVFLASYCEASVYVSDGSAQNVQYVHDNLAQNGDTITLPAGTFTWITGVVFTKAITLQGEGIGSTIIRDAITSGAPLIKWTLLANLLSQITAIEFHDGGRTPFASACGGWLDIIGNNTNGSQFRMHHCQVGQDGTALNGLAAFNAVIGVIDHCTWYSNGGDDQIGICGGNLGCPAGFSIWRRVVD